jgi:methyl-accepting chemotaxis protein
LNNFCWVSASAAKDVEHEVYLSFITTGCVVVFGLLIATVHELVITRPLHVIRSRMIELVDGDQGVEIRGTARRDGDRRQTKEEADAERAKANEEAEQRRKQELQELANTFEKGVGAVIGNVEHAAAGTETVSSNIAEVSEAAAETGEAAGHVLGASHELSTQAKVLRTAVDEFLDKVRAA